VHPFWTAWDPSSPIHSGARAAVSPEPRMPRGEWQFPPGVSRNSRCPECIVGEGWCEKSPFPLECAELGALVTWRRLADTFVLGAVRAGFGGLSAEAAGETDVFCVLSPRVAAVDELTMVDCVLSFLSSSSESSSDIRSVGAVTRFRLIAYTLCGDILRG